MAESKGTASATEAGTPPHDAAFPTYTESGAIARPDGWMYKGFRVGKTEYWYASPKIQLLMVAMVCFLCPGMYNALGGLGGGGQVDPQVQNVASTALYSVFAVVAFFAGTFANVVGVKVTISLGGLGYCLYAASFLCYNHTANRGFVIFAGAFLGLCAGLLWTAQGAIMMSYPPEQSKGRYISTFWIIFNLGAVIGALIPLGQNINTTTNGSVNDGTYVGFIVLMVIGAALSLCLTNANSIRREDGSKVIMMKSPTWVSEFKGLWECLYEQPWVIALFPMFFASNIFYTYQQNDFNSAHFNVRTRALNNLLYWLAQIFGAVIVGFALDYPGLRRSLRAKISFCFLFAITFVIWGGGYAFQRDNYVSRVDVLTDDWVNNHTMDWTTPGYVGPMFLYIFYGVYDAVWQTCIYWYMGALSNSSRKTANMAGFYKGMQSAGAAVFYALDSVPTDFAKMFAITWGVCAASLAIAGPIIFLLIKDTTTLEDDLKFSDETIQEVAPAAVLEERRASADLTSTAKAQ